VAITTSSIAVGARCPHARARVGAVATQNVTVGASGTESLLLQMASFDYAAYMSIYATPTPTAGRIGPRATPFVYTLGPVS
jgi:hypothetical protein